MLQELKLAVKFRMEYKSFRFKRKKTALGEEAVFGKFSTELFMAVCAVCVWVPFAVETFA